MNGKKLGGKKKPKNSYSFENEFIEEEQRPKLQHNQPSEEEEDEEDQISDFNEDDPTDVKLLVESNFENGESPKSIGKGNEKKRLKKLNNSMEQLSLSLLRMKERYKDLDIEEVLFKKRSYQKQAEVKEFLARKREQKRNLRKKMRRIKKKQAEKLQESISLEEEQKRNIPKRRVEEHLKKISEIKEKRKSDKQKDIQQEKFVSDMYSKIHADEKQKKKFHLRKAAEDKKKQIKEMQKRKQFLAKRKQNYKPLDISELESHFKKHEELLEQLQSQKRAKKEEEYTKILNSNQKLEQIFRGHNYDQAQEEYEGLKRKRSQPKEKYNKMKNYQEYVRENFIPATQEKHSEKQLQLEGSRSAVSHRQVKRYRFLQGISHGEIIEHRPLAKSEAQQRKIGNGYMAYMRSLPKKRHGDDESDISQQEARLLDQKLKEITSAKKNRNWIYEGPRARKSLDIKMSENPTRAELNMLMSQLRSKDANMEMRERVVKGQTNNLDGIKSKQKEINENIVDNIERKLNLLAKL